MVATIWLGALPWATVYAWRMYFNLGDVTYVLVYLLNATILTVLTQRALDRRQEPARQQLLHPTSFLLLLRCGHRHQVEQERA